MVSVPLLVMSSVMARADYSNAVMSLNPVGYWPLNETNLPPQNYTAHNSGTLGTLGNGYYNNVYHRSGATYTAQSYFTGPVGGVTSDGDAGAFFNGGTNGDDNAGYMIIPDLQNSLDRQSTFTAEVWVKPGGGDPNDVTGTSYASTEWTSIVEKGGGGNGYNMSGDASGNVRGWSVELAGIYTVGPPVGWYLPSAGATTPIFNEPNRSPEHSMSRRRLSACQAVARLVHSEHTQHARIVDPGDGQVAERPRRRLAGDDYDRETGGLSSRRADRRVLERDRIRRVDGDAAARLEVDLRPWLGGAGFLGAHHHVEEPLQRGAAQRGLHSACGRVACHRERQAPMQDREQPLRARHRPQPDGAKPLHQRASQQRLGDRGAEHLTEHLRRIAHGRAIEPSEVDSLERASDRRCRGAVCAVPATSCVHEQPVAVEHRRPGPGWTRRIVRLPL